MDVSAASTRAFAEYHSFHERLNLGLKTSAVSFIILRDKLVGGLPSIERVKAVCYSDGSLWGGMPGWGDRAGATTAIAMANHDLGCWGVIQSFSAFDVFLETLDAELHAWREKLKRAKPEDGGNNSSPRSTPNGELLNSEDKQAVRIPEVESEDEEDSLGRALRFYTRHNWKSDSVQHLIPVYTYFRRLRNCVAHSSSRATGGLADAAADKAWAEALKNWPSGDLTLPAPHPYRLGELIEITYREALLASSMLRSLAYDMTQKAMQELGQDGLIHLVVARLLKYRELTPVGGKDSTALFHKHLENIYRVTAMTNNETRQILEKLGHWKVWNDWHQAVRTEAVGERKKLKAAKASRGHPKLSRKRHPQNGK